MAQPAPEDLPYSASRFMRKSTCTYWNPLNGDQRWRWLEGLEGQVEEVILRSSLKNPATSAKMWQPHDR